MRALGHDLRVLNDLGCESLRHPPNEIHLLGYNCVVLTFFTFLLGNVKARLRSFCNYLFIGTSDLGAYIQK